MRQRGRPGPPDGRGGAGRGLGLLGILLVLAAPWGAGAAAPAPEAARPARALALLTDYAGVVVPVGETVRLALTVENGGRQDETVALRLGPVPPGWRATLRGGDFTVTGVAVPAGATRALTFEAAPAPGGGRPGTYVFGLTGASPDGQLVARYAITITTRVRPHPEAGALQVTTAYPVLRGPSDTPFDVALEVANTGETDRTVALAAQLPPRWQVSFKPGYEAKLISSVALRAGGSQPITATLTPPPAAAAGDYPVLLQAQAGAARAAVALHVVLTGTYQLTVATPTGLLSAAAVAGAPTTVPLVVTNTGSAANRTISLTAFKPENWTVAFAPDQLAALAPGARQTVQATITPAATALVGDYSVSLTADGEKGSSQSLDLRVAVAPAPGWAWVGVGLIALALGGLGGLFAWLGRR
jgi:uncharacterized membrane protein